MGTIPFLVVLAAVFSAGLFVLVRSLIEHPRQEISQLVTARVQSHLGQAPASLRDIEMQQSFVDRIIRPILVRGSETLERRTPATRRAAIETKIALAGKADMLDAGGFMVVRYAAATATAILGLLLGLLLGSALFSMVALVVGGILGFVLPMTWLNRAAGRRGKQMRRQLPDVLDLMTITVQAGLSFDAALARVAEKYSEGALGEEFNQVLQETRLGKPRLEALADMAERSGAEEVANFVQAVIQSEQMGIGIGKILRLQAEDLRRTRIQRAKIKAARSTLYMLLPMAGCMLPTLFIIVLGPSVFIFLTLRG